MGKEASKQASMKCANPLLEKTLPPLEFAWQNSTKEAKNNHCHITKEDPARSVSEFAQFMTDQSVSKVQ